MKQLTVKQILNINDDELEEMMTDEQFDRMLDLGFKYTWQFLDMLRESARLSGQKPNEKHTSIEEYLEFLEDMESRYNERQFKGGTNGQ